MSHHDGWLGHPWQCRRAAAAAGPAAAAGLGPGAVTCWGCQLHGRDYHDGQCAWTWSDGRGLAAAAAAALMIVLSCLNLKLLTVAIESDRDCHQSLPTVTVPAA